MQKLDSGAAIVLGLALMERQSSNDGGQEGAGIGFAEMDTDALEVQVPVLDDPYTARPGLGECLVTLQNRNRAFGPPSVSRAVFLDAGPVVRLTGPAFAEDLLRSGSNDYQTGLTPGTLLAGTWTYSSAVGSEIGAFQLAAELPVPLTWTNRQESIDPSQPLLVEWTGGGSEPIRITGTAGLEGPEGFAFGEFACVVSPETGSFTVPAEVLSTLPAGASGGISLSQRVTTTGFTVPPAAGHKVDDSTFSVFYRSSSSIQVQ